MELVAAREQNVRQDNSLHMNLLTLASIFNVGRMQHITV